MKMGRRPVLEPGREFKLVAENHLDAGCMASPAIVDHSLIVRTKKSLYRIEKNPVKRFVHQAVGNHNGSL